MFASGLENDSYTAAGINSAVFVFGRPDGLYADSARSGRRLPAPYPAPLFIGMRWTVNGRLKISQRF